MKTDVTDVADWLPRLVAGPPRRVAEEPIRDIRAIAVKTALGSSFPVPVAMRAGRQRRSVGTIAIPHLPVFDGHPASLARDDSPDLAHARRQLEPRGHLARDQ